MLARQPQNRADAPDLHEYGEVRGEHRDQVTHGALTQLGPAHGHHRPDSLLGFARPLEAGLLLDPRQNSVSDIRMGVFAGSQPS